MPRSNNFPAELNRLYTILGILLVMVYLVRPIILTPASPLVLYPDALTGCLLNPIFYI